MELELVATNHRVKKEVTKDHYWYDADKRQMYHGKGGRMVFEYHRPSGKSYPKIIDHEEWIMLDSYDDIVKWVENNDNEFNFTISRTNPRRSVILDVDPGDVTAITEDLYRHRIRFDYEERELNSQTSRGRSRWQNSLSRLPTHL